MSTYRFGMELEVSGGGDAILSDLYNSGHAGDDTMHAYHCGKSANYYSGHRCNVCNPERTEWDWTCQDDCTADAEFISRILTTGTEGDRALETLAAAMLAGRAEFSTEVGMHIHVDAGPFEDDDAALVRLYRLWLTYEQDFGTLARGSYRAVRSYNSPINLRLLGYGRHDDAMVRQFFDADHDDAINMIGEYFLKGDRSGHWLSGGRAAGTFEFRIWNATRSLWRMRMAVYVSVATARAALDGVECRPDDGRTLLDVLAPYLPDDVIGHVFTHLASIDN